MAIYRSLAVARKVSAADTNALVAKSTGGKVMRVTVQNEQAAAVYLKLYDQTAVPSPSGGDVPKLTYRIPADSQLDVNMTPEGGVAFLNGIAMVLVTGVADTDETAPTAGQQIVTILHK